MVISFADRTVLITGANNGIGAATVRAFARHGARIGLHFLEAAPRAIDGVQIGHTFAGRDAAETVAAEARALGGSVVLAPADLADPEAIGPLFDAVNTGTGPGRHPDQQRGALRESRHGVQRLRWDVRPLFRSQ